MPPHHVAARRPRVVRHSRGARSHRVARGVALSLTAVLAFGASSVAALAYRLDSNMGQIDVDALLGPAPSSSATPDPEDPNAGRAINILVLGSDYRDEAAMAAEGKKSAGMRADTTIVVHVSSDRSRVELVSIPRDSLVEIPSCLMSDGSTTRAQGTQMINSAFALGWDNGGDLVSAAACAGRTVQDNTGLAIDHFVVVDFAGFQSMVDAIGGVDICIPEDLSDPYTGLNLSAGQQVLNGENAFKFARARHGNVGDGSDIARIGNQQRLIAAVVNQVLSRDVMTNPTTLVSFLSAATGSLTTDDNLSLTAMTGLGYSLRSLAPGAITFMTIPWAAAASDKNRIEWTSEAATVWERMAADEPITGEAAATPTPTATTPTGTSTTPADAPADTAPPAATDPAAVDVAPTPAETKVAGREAFTPADVTAVCS